MFFCSILCNVRLALRTFVVNARKTKTNERNYVSLGHVVSSWLRSELVVALLTRSRVVSHH